MKKSELKALIREVIEEMQSWEEDYNSLGTIETSKGVFTLWYEEDREEDNIKKSYYIKGPDGKTHSVPGLSPYGYIEKKDRENIKQWIEKGMTK
jgi:hypothetical protein